MSERLFYTTEMPDLELRELVPEDAEPYFAAVDASREHLSQYGDITALKYPDIESVRSSITNPDYRYRDKLRMGIWKADTFVGSINLMPMNERFEVGYWLDQRHLGHGYATLALGALAERAPAYTEVFAAINAHNSASAAVAQRAGFVLDSSDGDIDYYIHPRKKPSKQKEPVLYAQTTVTDEMFSIAKIGLRGRNVAAVNHGSNTLYEVLYGNGEMNVGGTYHPLFEGAKVEVPMGTPYQDKGHLVMDATCDPPFDQNQVELLGYDIID